MGIKNKKYIVFSLMVVNSSISLGQSNDAHSLSAAAIPTSVYLENTIELISSIDFNMDTQQDIDNKLAEAQELLSKARSDSKLMSVTFTEVKE